MDELTLDNKKYLSSKHAAKVTGYAKDYVGQLCREGRIEARLVGRNWYALESSILEHRFGPSRAVNEPEQHPEVIPAAPTSSWEPPRYVPEPITLVPELVPKPVQAPVSPESNAVLLDMQSAWKEWFDSQEKRVEAHLPDASEMLLEDHLEAPHAPLTPVEMFEEVLQSEEPVHISRSHIGDFRPDREPAHLNIEPMRSATAPMEVRDVYKTRDAEAVRAQKVRKVRPERAKVRAYRAGKSNSFIPKALFFSLAGLAIAIAIIGTGVADPYIPTKGLGTFITDFISGTQVIK